MAKTKTVKFCSHCRSCERREEADLSVRGFSIGRDGRRIPYRAYLCEDHHDMLIDDGYELRTVEYLSEHAIDQHVTKILRGYTAYLSTREFLANNPTLRPGTFPGVEYLRKYYKQRTGREAAK
jgi:hypothetical protein